MKVADDTTYSLADSTAKICYRIERYSDVFLDRVAMVHGRSAIELKVSCPLALVEPLDHLKICYRIER